MSSNIFQGAITIDAFCRKAIYGASGSHFFKKEHQQHDFPRLKASWRTTPVDPVKIQLHQCLPTQIYSRVCFCFFHRPLVRPSWGFTSPAEVWNTSKKPDLGIWVSSTIPKLSGEGETIMHYSNRLAAKVGQKSTLNGKVHENSSKMNLKQCTFVGKRLKLSMGIFTNLRLVFYMWNCLTG